MKQGSWCLVVIAIVVLTVALAGCSSNTSGAAQSSSGSGSSGSSASGGAATAAGGGNCPSVDAAHSWAGKWDSQATSEYCIDMRKVFYPATKDNPNPWDDSSGGYGGMELPVTFTQTGCDVTGSIIVGNNGTGVAPHGCPITLTGKVDKDTVLSGTWKAYCNIEFRGGDDKGDDAGVFTLWMEPGGTTFIGTFEGNNPGIAKGKAAECPSANGNWAGKRV